MLARNLCCVVLFLLVSARVMVDVIFVEAVNFVVAIIFVAASKFGVAVF